MLLARKWWVLRGSRKFNVCESNNRGDAVCNGGGISVSNDKANDGSGKAVNMGGVSSVGDIYDAMPYRTATANPYLHLSTGR